VPTAPSRPAAYVNHEPDGGDRIRSAYRDNLDRLVAVKTAWDPDNLFRLNRNVRPASGG
jgi:hypothetical protein